MLVRRLVLASTLFLAVLVPAPRAVAARAEVVRYSGVTWETVNFCTGESIFLQGTWQFVWIPRGTEWAYAFSARMKGTSDQGNRYLLVSNRTEAITSEWRYRSIELHISAGSAPNEIWWTITIDPEGHLTTTIEGCPGPGGIPS